MNASNDPPCGMYGSTYLMSEPDLELALWGSWVLDVCRWKSLRRPSPQEWGVLRATWSHGKAPIDSVRELLELRAGDRDGGASGTLLGQVPAAANRDADTSAIDLPCPVRGCSGQLRAGGTALQTTLRGMEDFVGGHVVTMSPGGPGRLVSCLKCDACGHSVSCGPARSPADPHGSAA